MFGFAKLLYNNGPRFKVLARAIPGIVLGCDDDGNLSNHKLLNSVHVTFEEHLFPRLEKWNSISSGEDIFNSGDNYNDSEKNSDANIFLIPDIYDGRCPSRERKSVSCLGFQKVPPIIMQTPLFL